MITTVNNFTSKQAYPQIDLSKYKAKSGIYKIKVETKDISSSNKIRTQVMRIKLTSTKLEIPEENVEQSAGSSSNIKFNTEEYDQKSKDECDHEYVRVFVDEYGHTIKCKKCDSYFSFYCDENGYVNILGKAGGSLSIEGHVGEVTEEGMKCIGCGYIMECYHKNYKSTAYDNMTHYKYCLHCRKFVGAESHQSEWIRENSKHYKKCEKCGIVYSEGAHKWNYLSARSKKCTECGLLVNQ